MDQPKVTRPHFPKGYVNHPKSFLTWDQVLKKFTRAIHYWFCSVTPDARPHVVPKWGVVLEGQIYYDGSPETRHARNIAQNPSVAVHLEDGSQVVIIQGRAQELKQSPLELRERIAEAYRDKYADLGYSPEPSIWEAGGLFRLTIESVIAWTNFTEDPTRFVFES